MKIAIMQPYFFPYIGYYQLINSVDKFLIYDNVSFIKRGWINRNKIYFNNLEYLFTIPLKNTSRNRNINEHFISDEFFKWKDDFYKTLNMSYGKSKNYNDIMGIIEKSLNYENISDITSSSLSLVSDYLDINTNFKKTSELKNINSKKTERLIDICKIEKADTYINSIGGQELYSKDDFILKNINLLFLKCNDPKEYVSIVDLLMKYGKDTKQFLNNYELI
jgi:hypothetical protein